MIEVSIYKQSNYPVDSIKIKKQVAETLRKNGMVSDCELSIAIVGEAYMKKLVKDYLGENDDHPVLSFPSSEINERFAFPPDEKIHLGEIVISYPQAVIAAKKNEKLIDEVVGELAEHGALHLIGVHHD